MLYELNAQVKSLLNLIYCSQLKTTTMQTTSQITTIIQDQVKTIRQINKSISDLNVYTKKRRLRRSVNLVSSVSRLKSYIMK